MTGPSVDRGRGTVVLENTEAPEIRCRNVWKVFGAAPGEFERAGGVTLDDEAYVERGWTPAVRDASFNIPRGEVFVIMGLSGSGKSTIVRCLSRLIEPTIGEVFVEGTDLLAANEAELIEIRRRKMGMVFQHFALLPNRDVVGNVGFPLQVQGVARAEREARAREMVSLVGLDGREDHYPHELSGGQQQRVGIARSLASDPSIWFLDEPFSALDPLIRADLQDELLRLQEQLGKTIVFITHDLDEAIKIADRIAIMEQGRIVQIGSPEDLILRPANDYVARFTKGVPRAKVVRAATIMRKVDGAEAETSIAVRPNDRIADVADILTKSEGVIAVRDEAGRVHGIIDRETFIQVLAGATL
ncbi:MAG: betaine/proline/choline family ABC transporter ATP-binding protein [Pseudomonadota bacterium]